MGGRGSSSRSGAADGALAIGDVEVFTEEAWYGNYEYLNMLKDLGFVRGGGYLSDLDSEVMKETYNALAALEERFGVVSKADKVTFGVEASEEGTHAYTRGSFLFPGEMDFVLSTRYTAQQNDETIRRKSAEGYSVQYDAGRYTGTHYLVAHEYGHMVENVINRNSKVNSPSGYYMAAEQRKMRILEIARTKYGSSDGMSEYGSSNANEFFAEAFANSQLGKPNAIGRAMNDFLAETRRNGLL